MSCARYNLFLSLRSHYTISFASHGACAVRLRSLRWLSFVTFIKYASNAFLVQAASAKMVRMLLQFLEERKREAISVFL